MTTENALTEEEVYSLIVTGDIARSAALQVIRAYGNRKVFDALQQARTALPGAVADEAEIDLRFASCLQKLDEFTRLSVAAIGQRAQ
jgi:hypothetical protein